MLGKRMRLVAVAFVGVGSLLFESACSSGHKEPTIIGPTVSPTAGRLRQTTTSNRELWDWFYPQENAAAFGTDFAGSETSSSDDFSIDFGHASKFVTKDGIASGTTFAYYDPERETLVLHWIDRQVNYSPQSTVAVISQIRPPRFAIARINSAAIATLHGIKIGSTLSDVQRVYGKAFVLHGPYDFFAYETWQPTIRGAGLDIGTAFVLRNGRVVAIWRSSRYFKSKPPPPRGD